MKMIQKTLTGLVLAASLALVGCGREDWPTGPTLGFTAMDTGPDRSQYDVGDINVNDSDAGTDSEPDVTPELDSGNLDTDSRTEQDSGRSDIPYTPDSGYNDDCNRLDQINAPSGEQTTVDVNQNEIASTRVRESSNLRFRILDKTISLHFNEITPEYLTADLTMAPYTLEDRTITRNQPFRLYLGENSGVDLMLNFTTYNPDNSAEFLIDRCNN